MTTDHLKHHSGPAARLEAALIRMRAANELDVPTYTRLLVLIGHCQGLAKVSIRQHFEAHAPEWVEKLWAAAGLKEQAA